jgi:hypothetical protein
MHFTVTGMEMPIHLPIPLHLFAGLKSPTTLREPELRCDIRVNERLEHIRDRSADEHAGFCNRRLAKLKVLHVHTYADLDCAQQICDRVLF